MVRMAELNRLDPGDALVGCIRGIGADFEHDPADAKE
jgi:hypothetical protein